MIPQLHMEYPPVTVLIYIVISYPSMKTGSGFAANSLLLDWRDQEQPLEKAAKLLNGMQRPKPMGRTFYAEGCWGNRMTGIAKIRVGHQHQVFHDAFL